MKKRTARALKRAQKKYAKATSERPGAKSKYARKRAWCVSKGVFGFEIPEPKPWK